MTDERMEFENLYRRVFMESPHLTQLSEEAKYTYQALIAYKMFRAAREADSQDAKRYRELFKNATGYSIEEYEDAYSIIHAQ